MLFLSATIINRNNKYIIMIYFPLSMNNESFIIEQ